MASSLPLSWPSTSPPSSRMVSLQGGRRVYQPQSSSNGERGLHSPRGIRKNPPRRPADPPRRTSVSGPSSEPPATKTLFLVFTRATNNSNSPIPSEQEVTAFVARVTHHEPVKVLASNSVTDRVAFYVTFRNIDLAQEVQHNFPKTAQLHGWNATCSRRFARRWLWLPGLRFFEHKEWESELERERFRDLVIEKLAQEIERVTSHSPEEIRVRIAKRGAFIRFATWEVGAEVGTALNRTGLVDITKGVKWDLSDFEFCEDVDIDTERMTDDFHSGERLSSVRRLREDIDESDDHRDHKRPRTPQRSSGGRSRFSRCSTPSSPSPSISIASSPSRSVGSSVSPSSASPSPFRSVSPEASTTSLASTSSVLNDLVDDTVEELAQPQGESKQLRALQDSVLALQTEVAKLQQENDLLKSWQTRWNTRQTFAMKAPGVDPRALGPQGIDEQVEGELKKVTWKWDQSALMVADFGRRLSEEDKKELMLASNVRNLGDSKVRCYRMKAMAKGTEQVIDMASSYGFGSIDIEDVSKLGQLGHDGEVLGMTGTAIAGLEERTKGCGVLSTVLPEGIHWKSGWLGLLPPVKGLNLPVWNCNQAGFRVPLSFEPANCGRVSFMVAERNGVEALNCYAKWIIVSSKHSEKLQQLLADQQGLAEAGSGNGDRRLWIRKSFLSQHGIEFEEVIQKSGDLLVLNALSPHWVKYVDESKSPKAAPALFNDFTYNFCAMDSEFLRAMHRANGGGSYFDEEAFLWAVANYLKSTASTPSETSELSASERALVHQAIGPRLQQLFDSLVKSETELKSMVRQIKTKGVDTMFAGVRNLEEDGGLGGQYEPRTSCASCRKLVFGQAIGPGGFSAQDLWYCLPCARAGILSNATNCKGLILHSKSHLRSILDHHLSQLTALLNSSTPN